MEEGKITVDLQVVEGGNEVLEAVRVREQLVMPRV